MKLAYETEKIESICESLKAARKFFDGNIQLANSLMARIKDIIVQPAFHFHKLTNKNGRDLEGYFAIDVKSRREQWRIILEPLDENISPYNPCKIDEIAEQVKIIGVMEVSRHYE